MNQRLKLEIAVVGAAGAGIAADEGADRIELCSSLEIGGITPTQGLMEAAVEAVDQRLEIHALIRCRPGNFHYSRQELDTMAREAKHLMAQGASGIVFGVLTDQGNVDTEATRRIAEAAKDIHPLAQLTFHRAIDQAQQPLAAIDTLVELGFDRVLTSGGAPTAGQGLGTLRRMSVRAAGALEIMAGGGLTINDIPFMRRSGVVAVHMSAKRIVSTLRAGTISLGQSDSGDPTAYMTTDRAILNAARSACQ
ncbi:copper homeostasis protein CutC [Arthrobacter sp. UYEF3]|uniref:copper homeostasis protein CutC n=1 Tax=Arthrobacter sp. UYEF3 TaxID=1756365 RepID=UPI0033932479